MKNLTKAQTIILFIIFIAIGGIVLYGGNTNNNFNPLDYVFKR
jgi:Ni,Fe-hydrogenase I cytochrome b subunit